MAKLTTGVALKSVSMTIVVLDMAAFAAEVTVGLVTSRRRTVCQPSSSFCTCRDRHGSGLRAVSSSFLLLSCLSRTAAPSPSIVPMRVFTRVPFWRHSGHSPPRSASHWMPTVLVEPAGAEAAADHFALVYPLCLHTSTYHACWQAIMRSGVTAWLLYDRHVQTGRVYSGVARSVGDMCVDNVYFQQIRSILSNVDCIRERITYSQNSLLQLFSSRIL